MYLSRIKLNTTNRNTYKFFASLEVAHAAVEAMFSFGDQSRKLWRLDYLNGQAYILILSASIPNMESFIEQFGYYGDAGETREYTKLLDILQTGQKYRFRLTANPVKSIKQEGQARGKVVGHITVEQQEGWLLAKSSKNGFKVVDFRLVQRDIKRFRRKNRGVTLAVAEYEGVLQITDLEAFKSMLVNGLGRGKAYGCGLLTLARL